MAALSRSAQCGRPVHGEPLVCAWRSERDRAIGQPCRATLLATGAAEPRRHLFLAAAGKVATLIVAKSPLSPSALAALKDAAKANEFTVLLSPDTAAPSAMLEKIVSAPDRRALDQATAGFYLDLTPPTDARPSSSTS
jgi:hypothetical protein